MDAVGIPGRTVVTVMALLLLPQQAVAQGKGDVEVFFGVNHLPLALDGVQQATGESRLKLWGVHGDIAFYLSDNFGIVLDGSFPRQDLDIAVPTIEGDLLATVDFSQATYMVGPRLRFNRAGALTPSVQALLGFAKGSVGTVQIEGVDVPILVDLDDSSFAASAAANLDLRLGDSFALRLLQAGVLLTGYGDGSQTSLRLSAGLVGRF